MTEYTVCFDFPESPDPWFAGKVGGAFGLVAHMDDAIRFESEDAADRLLTNGYGDGTRPYGTVVEIGA